MNNDQFFKPIVLIEDNPVDLDLTLRALKKRKLSNPIKVARDGEEAIALFDNWGKEAPKPVVVLLDLKLPKFSGLEVLKHIRSSCGFEKVPIVVLTSSSEDKDIQAAYDIGVNSYILKPVDFEKFVQMAEHIEIYWCVLNEPYC